MRRLTGAWLLFLLILLLKSSVLFQPSWYRPVVPEAKTSTEMGKSVGRAPSEVTRSTPRAKPPLTRARYGSDPSRAEAVQRPTSFQQAASGVDSAGRKLLFFFSTAPRDSLILLPGIGPVLADRIINARSGKRLFKTWDDLRAVKGIGAKKIEKFKHLAATE